MISIYLTLLLAPFFLSIYSSLKVEQLSGSQLTTGLLLLGLSLELLLYILKNNPKIPNKVALFLGICLTLSLYIFVIDLSYGKNVLDSLVFPLKILFLLSLFLASFFHKEKIISKNLVKKFLIWNMIIITIFIGFDYITKGPYYSGIDYGVSKRPPFFGAFLVSILPGLIINYSRLLITILGMLIFLTFRRSAWLAFTNGLFMFFLLSKQRLSRKIVNSLLTIALILISIYLLVAEANLIPIFLKRISDPTGSGRSIFWKLSLSLFNQEMDYFEKIFGNPTLLRSHLHSTFGIPIGAHSDFLDFLINYGVVGFLLYFLSIIVLFIIFSSKKCSPSSNNKIAAIAGLTAHVTNSLVSGGFFDTTSTYLFFVLGVIAYAKQETNTIKY